MALNIFKWLVGDKQESTMQEVTCQEFLECAEDFYARNVAFQVCANMIANAVAKCEFKTYSGGKPTKADEYYLWNVEPNINQNSSEFLHELIFKLLTKNEALVIPVRQRGFDHMVIADSWICPDRELRQDAIYQDVTIGGFTYSKTFHEEDVLHFKLNQKDVSKAVSGLYASYAKLLDAATKDYEWNAGHHLKVHVSQIAQGEKDFEKKFTARMAKQVQPFMKNANACLPEFEGYEYTDMSGAAVKRDTRDIRALYNDTLDFTAQAFGIPPVLMTGTVADSKDALTRWLTDCIDPICCQLEEEITRKRYGYAEWAKGNYLYVDTSTIIHFDLFQNAANVEKLIGSGCYSINDVLTASGQPVLPNEWANTHWLTLNIAKIEQAATSTQTANGEEGG